MKTYAVLLLAALTACHAPRPPRQCDIQETRRAWLMADVCVATGGVSCWDAVQRGLGCKAL